MRSALSLFVVFVSLAGPVRGQGHLYSVGGGSGWDSEPAVVGDTNGDGISDFAISHSGASGSIELRSGADGTLILVIDTGQKTTELSAAGDVDKDGDLDLVAGYWLSGGTLTNAGRARVFSAEDGALIRDHQGGPDDFLGLRVAGAVDLDQDGYDDYLVRCHEKTRAYSGATGAVMQTTLHPTGGAGLAGLGDVDGDGFDDWAVGTRPPSAGSVRVLSGQTGDVLYEVFGKKAHQHYGHALARVGDLDGDDRPDILVGMPGDNQSYKEPGRARVLSGASGATLFTWKGTSTHDGFGRAVGAAGDVDGDGTPDVLVGAPFDPTAGKRTGRVLVLSGAKGKTLFTRFGTHAPCELGRSVASLGDVDADGVPDLLAGREVDLSTYAALSVYSGSGAEFEIGTEVVGTIEQAWPFQSPDVDEIFFAGVAGQKLELDVEVLSGDLRPRLAIVDLAGETLEKLAFGGPDPAPKSFGLKKTGLYRLRIRGLKNAAGDHTQGEYRVDTDSTFKGKAAPQSVLRKGKPGKTLVVKLDALPGATLQGILVPLKYDGLLPYPTLAMPDGQTFSLGAFTTQDVDGTILLNDIPLPALGRYELRLPTAPTGKSKVRFELGVIQPKGIGSIEAH